MEAVILREKKKKAFGRIKCQDSKICGPQREDEILKEQDL